MTKRRKRTASGEERAAIHFEPVGGSFDWTNEDWARKHLVNLRIAFATLQQDDRSLERSFAKLIPDGVIPDILDNWCVTKDHLKSLVEMVDVALTRSFVVLERLGYRPNQPPPDTPQSLH